jgi:hypothetical protein
VHWNAVTKGTNYVLPTTLAEVGLSLYGEMHFWGWQTNRLATGNFLHTLFNVQQDIQLHAILTYFMPADPGLLIAEMNGTTALLEDAELVAIVQEGNDDRLWTAASWTELLKKIDDLETAQEAATALMQRILANSIVGQADANEVFNALHAARLAFVAAFENLEEFIPARCDICDELEEDCECVFCLKCNNLEEDCNCPPPPVCDKCLATDECICPPTRPNNWPFIYIGLGLLALALVTGTSTVLAVAFVQKKKKKEKKA